MDVTKYKINNARVIGKLLPFFINGRKTNLLLQASAYPLKSVHAETLKWIEEMLIEAKVTAQPKVLTWYLKHKLKDVDFADTDGFQIIDNALSEGEFIYNIEESNITRVNDYAYCVENDTVVIGTSNLLLINKNEDVIYGKDVVVEISDINESDDYSRENYLNDIKKIIDKYITNINDYEIKIRE